MTRENERPSDEQLARRAREGDEAALRDLFARHREALRVRVKSRLPASVRRRVAESDVLQDAYLVAHRRLAEFEDRGDGSFRRWLDRIVEHKVRDEVRGHVASEKRSVRREVTESRRPSGVSHAGIGPTPSGHAMVEESRALVRAALSRLSEDYRRILLLIHEEGLSLAEAGGRLARSAEAARKLYGRAAAALAREMEER